MSGLFLYDMRRAVEFIKNYGTTEDLIRMRDFFEAQHRLLHSEIFMKGRKRHGDH